LEGSLRQAPSRTESDFVAGFGGVVAVVLDSCESGIASKE